MARSSGTDAFILELTDNGVNMIDNRRDGSRVVLSEVFSNHYAAIAANVTLDDVIPWYSGDNNEPEYLMSVITNSPIAMGLLVTKASILYGQGPSLHRKVDGEWITLDREEWPEEIDDFFQINSVEDRVFETFFDWESVGNSFNHLIFSKLVKGSPQQVMSWGRISSETIRAIKPDDTTNPLIERYAVAPTWKDIGNTHEKYRPIRAFLVDEYFSKTRRFLPGETRNTDVVMHLKRNIPGYPHYGLPQWYGARKSAELQNQIPNLHIAQIGNLFGVRVRISVAQTLIDRRTATLNPTSGKMYTEQEVVDEVRDMLKEYFTNPKNVGKTLITKHVYDHQGKAMQDIIIEPIAIDLKDDAYTTISASINKDTISAFGVPPALADVISAEGLSSGSMQTQAWNILQAKYFQIREQALKPLRFIHRFNQWPSDLRWGFDIQSLVTKDVNHAGILPPSPPQP